MIIFDQLRISDDGKRLYINAHVNKADYFNDIYIDSIVIQTADKVSETDPGLPTSDYVYIKKAEENAKELNLVLEASDLSRSWESDPNAIAFGRGDMSKTLLSVKVLQVLAHLVDLMRKLLLVLYLMRMYCIRRLWIILRNL